jgi:hypothetical protein
MLSPERPWYTLAKYVFEFPHLANQTALLAIWTPPYKFKVEDRLGMTFAIPFASCDLCYTPISPRSLLCSQCVNNSNVFSIYSGNLTGVLAADIELHQISRILQDKFPHQSTVTVFIVEKTTLYLLGSSISASVFTNASAGNSDGRIVATQSDNSIISLYGSLLQNLSWPDRLIVYKDNYVLSTRFNSIRGVDWYIVVIVPWPGCAPGTYGPPLLGTSSCLVCSAGSFATSPNATSCVLCSPGSFSASPRSSECELCPASYFQSIAGQTQCQQCDLLSSTSSIGAVMCGCNDGFYLQNASCVPCPPHAMCSGSNALRTSSTLRSLPGSWRWVNPDLSLLEAMRKPPQFYTCSLSKQACLSSSNGSCAEGYTGVLCGVCTPGYRLNIQGCLPCGSNTILTAVLIISIGLALFALLIYVIRRVEAKYFLNSLQILVTFAQIVASTSVNYGTEHRWPAFMTSVMSLARIAMFDIYEGTAISCIIRHNYYVTYSFFAIGVTVATAITFFVRISVPYIWGKFYPELYVHLRKPLRDFCLKALVLFMGLVYPTVSLKTLLIWECTTVGNRSYLAQDVSIECSGSTYLAYSICNIFFVAAFVLGWYFAVYVGVGSTCDVHVCCFVISFARPTWQVYYLRKIRMEQELVGEHKIVVSTSTGKRLSAQFASKVLVRRLNSRILRMEARAGNLFLKFKSAYMNWGVWETLRQLFLVAVVCSLVTD